MDVSKNITALLKDDKCLEQWKNLLQGSRAALIQLGDDNRITPEDLVPVLKGPTDKIESYAELLPLYPFL